MTAASVDEVVEEPAPEIVARLVRAVLLKSLLEILILCLVLGIAGFKYFNPTIRGEITQADAVSVRGWVANPMAPRDPIQLELAIDGRPTAIMTALEVQPEHAASALLRRGQHSVRVFISTSASWNAFSSGLCRPNHTGSDAEFGSNYTPLRNLQGESG